MYSEKEIISRLKKVIKEKGLKYTKQREIILKTILNSDKHLTTEEIYNIIKKEYKDYNIGIATVYRTLIFLEEANLISSILIDNDVKKFETNFKNHHDHIICIKCNKIIEFFNEEIENIQYKIAKEYGFEIKSHTMNLYGICKECQNKSKS